MAKAVGEARGRDFRAPPLVRSFVRNAEVSTMVLVAVALAGQFTFGAGNVNVSLGGPGIIGTILIVQLVLLARRLLKEGYTFNDIRAALLAEARIQEEEAEAILKSNWLRKLDGLWHRIWAGRFGKWFFKVAGRGIKPPARAAVVSNDATELVLGRAAVDLYEDLSEADRTGIGDVPGVVRRLAERAERLRKANDTGDSLRNTVAALENVRLALLRLQLGEGSVEDLTFQLEKARVIGERVNRRLEAHGDVAYPPPPA
jgi:hypothetical protein